MDFRLLGDVEVWHDGRLLELTGRQRTVLAVLLVSAGKVVPRQDLIRLSWGSHPPPTAGDLVADYVSRLRTALRTGSTTGETVLLVSRPPGYRFEMPADPTYCCVDWHRFRGLHEKARAARAAADAETATVLFREALALWRGPALNDLGHPVEPLREAMTARRLEAVEELAEIELWQGAADQAVTLLLPLTAEFPARERLTAMLMRGLVALGRRDQALDAYHRSRRYLRDELGVDPTEILQRALQDVLNGQLPAEPAALAATSRRDLPHDTSHFVGRQAEIAELRRLLVEEERVETVVICAVDGMAGVGKTALAIRVAHQLVDRFPDGVLFIDLHGFAHDTEPVPPTIALDRLLRRLGVAGKQIPADLDDRAALYREYLTGRTMLIILDNARSAGQVRPLLPGTPGCRVIVTSRRRLAALDDAHPVSLDVLPLPAAVDLFARVSGDARRPGGPDLLERIVRRCGQLPLAVRIAATRLRDRSTWTLQELENRLAGEHDRLAALDDGERSIAAAFSISYTDLPTDEQLLFRALALLPGSDADRYVAAALAHLDLPRTTKVLEHLVDAHLLIQRVPGRYLFHDLLRADASDRAQREDSEAERRAALTRLFDYYLFTASAAMNHVAPHERGRRPVVDRPDLPTPCFTGYGTAMDWLEAERTNLVQLSIHAAQQGWPRHAISLSTTLWRFFIARDHYQNARTVHEQALTAGRHTGWPADEARALLHVGTAHYGQSHFTDACRHYERALTLARAIRDDTTERMALNSLGRSLWRLGRYPDAVRFSEEALSICRRTNDRVEESYSLTNLGLIEYRVGRHANALAYYERALALQNAVGDVAGARVTLTNIGLVHYRLGRYEFALRHYDQALRICRNGGNLTSRGEVLTKIADVYLKLGRCADARQRQEQALAIGRERGDRSLKCEALNGLGEVLCATGDAAGSVHNHQRALAMSTEVHNRYEQARAHHGLGRAYEGSNVALGQQHKIEALAIYSELGVPEAGELQREIERGGSAREPVAAGPDPEPVAAGPNAEPVAAGPGTTSSGVAEGR